MCFVVLIIAKKAVRSLELILSWAGIFTTYLGWGASFFPLSSSNFSPLIEPEVVENPNFTCG